MAGEPANVGAVAPYRTGDAIGLFPSPLQLVNGEPGGRNGLPRQLDEAGVVGEEEHLRLIGQLRQEAQGGGGAAVVEVDEQVVDHERDAIAGRSRCSC